LEGVGPGEDGVLGGVIAFDLVRGQCSVESDCSEVGNFILGLIVLEIVGVGRV